MIAMTDEVVDAVIEELGNEEPVTKVKKAKKSPPTMRMSVMQEQLARALKIVGSAIDSRPTLPVFANVLIETENDGGPNGLGSRVKLSATNLEVSITVYIGAKIDVAGSITLPHKTLTEIVNRMSPERIDFLLDPDTQTVNMRCGMSNNNLKGISPAEYPPIPGQPSEVSAFIAGRVFKKMVEQSAFSAAKEDNRPILTGLNFQIQGNRLVMAGADGYRLAVRTGPLTEETNYASPVRSMKIEDDRLVGQTLEDNVMDYREGHKNAILAAKGTVVTYAMIEAFTENGHVYSVNIKPLWLTPIHVDPICTVPVATLEAVAKLINVKDDKELCITLPGERDLIFFAYDGVVIASQLLDGKFPDFNGLIPASHNNLITVYTNDLLNAAQRAEIFARDSNYSMRLIAKPALGPSEPGTLQVIGKSAERGDNEGLMDAYIEGAELAFAVNCRYLIETLAHIPEERVVLTTLGEANPIVIRPEGDDNYLAIIMPMSINR